MASIRRSFVTSASPDAVWDAIQDVGALHTRLVPGFVIDTKLEPGARIVTFGNGMVVREPIVDIDNALRRLVWSAEGAGLSHYNASVQVLPQPTGGAEVVWIADLLPNDKKDAIAGMIDQGMATMKQTLDALSATTA